MIPTWALCLACSPLGVALGVGAGLATLEPTGVRVMPPLPAPPPYVAPVATPTPEPERPVVRMKARPAVAPAEAPEDGDRDLNRPEPAEPEPTLAVPDHVDGDDQQPSEGGEGGEPEGEAPSAPECGEDEHEEPAEGGKPADDVVADECAAAGAE